MNFNQELSHIKELTEQNNVTEALIAGCELLMKIDPSTSEAGLDDVSLKLKSVKAIEDNVGYMPPDLNSKRRVLYKRMLDTAKQILRPEHYQKFYMSF